MNINWIEATLLASAIFLGGLSLGAHAEDRANAAIYGVDDKPDCTAYSDDYGQHWYTVCYDYMGNEVFGPGVPRDPMAQ